LSEDKRCRIGGPVADDCKACEFSKDRHYDAELGMCVPRAGLWIGR
jgi:hypothetical protein